MPLRTGFLSTAHGHVWAYVHGFKIRDNAEIVGFWDDDEGRATAFAEKTGIRRFLDKAELLGQVDAVTITAANMRHADLVVAAARAGKHILCEKPVAATAEDLNRIEEAVRSAGVQFMTAFPCRYAPAYQRLKARVEAGDIGEVKAICATNRGTCPFDWFVQKEESGGGAMIDHVVHVADLLQDLLGEVPVSVSAQIGNKMYAQEWEDTAMVSVEYPSGVIATIDSSWSRPGNFRTWGDVTMNVVGTKGVIEMDLFSSDVHRYAPGNTTHTVAGYGTDLDATMIDEFINACLENRTPKTSMADGINAAKVALAGYASLA